ncbi:hypothetical protein HYFRA_00002929 [Hymenoscyphus fraxineus]|uniref:Uncharacterized protein n=1 Tax=Hymenoscyphus fraxineus TaxID=746836 RepID=A0A9N9KPH4_9HELO|nr:hypothetical protein HYFRA_00002929 [Hymenoscyphus fraxineus]
MALVLTNQTKLGSLEKDQQPHSRGLEALIGDEAVSNARAQHQLNHQQRPSRFVTPCYAKDREAGTTEEGIFTPAEGVFRMGSEIVSSSLQTCLAVVASDEDPTLDRVPLRWSQTPKLAAEPDQTPRYHAHGPRGSPLSLFPPKGRDRQECGRDFRTAKEVGSGSGSGSLEEMICQTARLPDCQTATKGSLGTTFVLMESQRHEQRSAASPGRLMTGRGSQVSGAWFLIGKFIHAIRSGSAHYQVVVTPRGSAACQKAAPGVKWPECLASRPGFHRAPHRSTIGQHFATAAILSTHTYTGVSASPHTVTSHQCWPLRINTTPVRGDNPTSSNFDNGRRASPQPLVEGEDHVGNTLGATRTLPYGELRYGGYYEVAPAPIFAMFSRSDDDSYCRMRLAVACDHCEAGPTALATGTEDYHDGLTHVMDDAGSMEDSTGLLASTAAP